MKNFKELGDRYCRNMREAVSQKSPEWSKIKSISVEIQSPHVLFLKYACDRTSYIPYVNRADVELDLLVSLSIENESTVSKAKKDDLLYMCKELIIPKDYHQF